VCEGRMIGLKSLVLPRRLVDAPCLCLQSTCPAFAFVFSRSRGEKFQSFFTFLCFFKGLFFSLPRFLWTG
jgi:hypothetical protein